MIPPCPAPEGGWPHLTWGHGDKNLEYDLGDLEDTGAAVAMTIFRPSEDQAVLVVAAADPAAVEAWLQPQLGELLGVVASKWTKAELEAVRAHLHSHHEEWNLYQWGPMNTEDGQTCMAAKLTRLLPQIAIWAASLPTGILSLSRGSQQSGHRMTRRPAVEPLLAKSPYPPASESPLAIAQLRSERLCRWPAGTHDRATLLPRAHAQYHVRQREGE